MKVKELLPEDVELVDEDINSILECHGGEWVSMSVNEALAHIDTLVGESNG